MYITGLDPSSVELQCKYCRLVEREVQDLVKVDQGQPQSLRCCFGDGLMFVWDCPLTTLRISSYALSRMFSSSIHVEYLSSDGAANQNCFPHAKCCRPKGNSVGASVATIGIIEHLSVLKSNSARSLVSELSLKSRRAL